MLNVLIPTHCPSCGKPVKVEGIHLICSNKQCPDQVIYTILHWVESRKMDGIATSTIKSLVEAGKINNILDLYSLTAKSLAGLDGFGDSKINNILNELERTKNMTIGQFCDALGMPLIGEKAIAKLGITTEDELWAFPGNDSVIGENLIGYLDEHKNFVKSLLKIVSIKAPKTAVKGSRSVCMTGSGPRPRKQLEDEIIANGDVFSDHVGKDTDILLCEDVKGSSSKLTKAAKMGVKLMAYSEYFR